MIFVGDVAIAAGLTFEFKGFPANILPLPWCVNLEGIFVCQESGSAWGCYNKEQWQDSFKHFNLGPVFVGNNHIHDVDEGITITAEVLAKANLPIFGAGRNIEIAQQQQRVFS